MTWQNGMEVGTPEEWVHESMNLHTWMNVYSHKINSMNGRDMWAKFDCSTNLLPPKVNPQIGRPPKRRKKSKGEIKMVKGNNLVRKGKTVTCINFQGTWHNKRSCSNGQRQRSVPMKFVGRKTTAQRSQPA